MTLSKTKYKYVVEEDNDWPINYRIWKYVGGYGEYLTSTVTLLGAKYAIRCDIEKMRPKAQKATNKKVLEIEVEL